MSLENITIRLVRPEDAREWCMLAIRVWRVAYRHIFPEEVFLEKENRVEEKKLPRPDEK